MFISDEKPSRRFVDDPIVKTNTYVQARKVLTVLEETVSRARMNSKPRKSINLFVTNIQGEEIPSLLDNPIKCLGKYFDAVPKDTIGINWRRYQQVVQTSLNPGVISVDMKLVTIDLNIILEKKSNKANERKLTMYAEQIDSCQSKRWGTWFFPVNVEGGEFPTQCSSMKYSECPSNNVENSKMEVAELGKMLKCFQLTMDKMYGHGLAAYLEQLVSGQQGRPDIREGFRDKKHNTQ
ncbi:hypothetical protein CHS0354_024403 [Potamilus streckersoni]|uniref:Uncharacterized protein n=1 Tax=Potamilus streckersoni TaxID=2493646 RepID=A0AAE0SVP7_9BIVA|nr:hypothetical protein CHS0354_024403 [Potamilus streckersoni]